MKPAIAVLALVLVGAWQSFKVVDVSAFDAPPKEWDTTELAYGINIAPPQPSMYQQHHVECADKSRVKLQSEDGKWHCFDFKKLALVE